MSLRNLGHIPPRLMRECDEMPKPVSPYPAIGLTIMILIVVLAAIIHAAGALS